MPHKIERINEYNDTRFPREVLLEHGAFLIDNKYKCSFKITRENYSLKISVFYGGKILCGLNKQKSIII